MKLIKAQWLVGVGFLFVTGWYAWPYFFDTTEPHIAFVGFKDGTYCAQDLSFAVKSTKTGSCVALVDSKPIADYASVKNKNGEFLFTLNTKSLANGTHTLSVRFVDGTYYQKSASIEGSFVVDNVPLNATLINIDEPLRVSQGRTLHVQFQANKPIKSATAKAFCAEYQCINESPGTCIYECFIPVSCEEQPNPYIVSIEIEDQVKNKQFLDCTVYVVEHQFKKQVLRVAQDKVKTERDAGPGEKEFESILANLTKQSPAVKLWKGPFCSPIDIKSVSCDFGTIRTSQHKGRYSHKALDVINDPGSVVWAPQDGVVVLKERFAASGNTVVIDHGCGVLSLLCHLNEFANIAVGEKIAKGNPVGTLGNTGWVTGPHLHWEHRVSNVPVDPIEWTQIAL